MLTFDFWMHISWGWIMAFYLLTFVSELFLIKFAMFCYLSWTGAVRVSGVKLHELSDTEFRSYLKEFI